MRTNREAEKLFEITIAGLPPTANTMWRSCYGKSGRTYKPKPVKDWQDNAAIQMMEAYRLKHCATYEGKARLTLILVTKNKRRMDIDNRIKALQDCLKPAGVLNDDSQVWELQVERQLGETDETIVALYAIGE